MKLTIRSRQGTSSHEFDKDLVSIGRASTNDVVIADQKASRHHCRIEDLGDKYRVVDLGSMNGTYLGHRRIDEAFCEEGDEVRIGDTYIRIGELTPELALVFLNGQRRGEIIPLRSRTLLIGRSQASDIVLDDRRVSSKHAEISRRREGVFIKDLGSKNGTYVNDSKVEEKVLNDGDIIRIGGYYFQFGGLQALEQGEVISAPVSEKGAWALLVPLVVVLAAVGYFFYVKYKPPPPPAPPLRNGNFDDVGEEGLKGWRLSAEKSKIGAERQEKGYALLIELLGGRASALSDEEVQVVGKASYRFSFRMKSSGLRGAGGLVLHWLNSEEAVSYALVAGDMEWQRHSTVLTAPEWAKKLRIECVAFGQRGTVLLDDIYWEASPEAPSLARWRAGKALLTVTQLGITELYLSGKTVMDGITLSIRDLKGEPRATQQRSLIPQQKPEVSDDGISWKLVMCDTIGSRIHLLSRWSELKKGIRVKYELLPEEDIPNDGVVVSFGGKEGVIYTGTDFIQPSSTPRQARSIEWSLPSGSVVVALYSTPVVSYEDGLWNLIWRPGTLRRNRELSLAFEIYYYTSSELARLEKLKKKAQSAIESKRLADLTPILEEITQLYPGLQKAMIAVSQMKSRSDQILAEIEREADNAYRKARLTGRQEDYERALFRYSELAKYAKGTAKGTSAEKRFAKIQEEIETLRTRREEQGARPLLAKALKYLSSKEYNLALLYCELLIKRYPSRADTARQLKSSILKKFSSNNED